MGVRHRQATAAKAAPEEVPALGDVEAVNGQAGPDLADPQAEGQMPSRPE